MSSELTTLDPAAEQALPDGGEPQGARDDRPAMLGKRFRQVIAAAMLIGLVRRARGARAAAKLLVVRLRERLELDRRGARRSGRRRRLRALPLRRHDRPLRHRRGAARPRRRERAGRMAPDAPAPPLGPPPLNPDRRHLLERHLHGSARQRQEEERHVPPGRSRPQGERAARHDPAGPPRSRCSIWA